MRNGSTFRRTLAAYGIASVILKEIADAVEAGIASALRQNRSR